MTYDSVVDQIASLEDASKRDDALRMFEPLLKKSQVTQFRRDAHFTFIETTAWMGKCNPRVFQGKYITITLREDGTLRLNFRPMPTGMTIDHYTFKVYCVLRKALEGLVEKDCKPFGQEW